jgi:hypothetical protein
MKLILLASVVLVITGCASATADWAATNSAGAIGCLSKDVTISDYDTTQLVVAEWVAECKGKKYICSTRGTSSTNCTESKLDNNTTQSTPTVKETISISQQTSAPQYKPIPVAKSVIENTTPTQQSKSVQPINDLKDCRYLETDFAIAECVRGK